MKKGVWLLMASLACGLLLDMENLRQVNGQEVAAHSAMERVAVVPGADPCAEIQAAINALPATGGIVDARGFTSDQTCARSVSTSLNNVTILLPPHHIVGGSWSLTGNGDVLEGTASGDNNSSTSALIELSPPTQSAFVTLGGNPVVIKNLSIFGPCGADGSCTLGGVNYQGLPYDGVHASGRFTVEGRSYIGMFPRYGLKLTGQDIQLNGLDVFGNGVAGIMSQSADVFVGPETESVNNGMFSFVIRNFSGGHVGAHHIHGGDYSGITPQFQTWQPDHSYALGTYISDCNIQASPCIGYAQEVTLAGVTSSDAPAFNPHPGGLTVDGTVRWVNRSQVGNCIVADGSASAIYYLQFIGLDVMPCYGDGIFAENITGSVIVGNYLSNVGMNRPNTYSGIAVLSGTGGNTITANEINGNGGANLAYGIRDTTDGIYAPDVIMANVIFNAANLVFAPRAVADVVGSGAPIGVCGNGSTYRNTKGSIGSTLYVCVNGKWVDVK